MDDGTAFAARSRSCRVALDLDLKLRWLNRHNSRAHNREPWKRATPAPPPCHGCHGLLRRLSMCSPSRHAGLGSCRGLMDVAQLSMVVARISFGSWPGQSPTTSLARRRLSRAHATLGRLVQELRLSHGHVRVPVWAHKIRRSSARQQHFQRRRSLLYPPLISFSGGPSTSRRSTAVYT